LLLALLNLLGLIELGGEVFGDPPAKGVFQEPAGIPARGAGKTEGPKGPPLFLVCPLVPWTQMVGTGESSSSSSSWTGETTIASKTVTGAGARASALTALPPSTRVAAVVVRNRSADEQATWRPERPPGARSPRLRPDSYRLPSS